MMRIGLADTMFARVDMGKIARQRLQEKTGFGSKFELVCVTVPGFKDLAVSAKKLIEEEKCEIVLAMGWSGGAELDGRSAQIASMGLMHAQLLTNRHILEVFVHAEEAPDSMSDLYSIAAGRVEGHADNAYDMICFPERLSDKAGRGCRQGGPHVGEISVPRL